MNLWFQNLSWMEWIFLLTAVPATLLLLVEIVLLLFGVGGGDSADVPDDLPDGMDTSGATDIPDGGLRLFTLWGIIAFFTVFGWSGLAMMRTGSPNMLCTLVALALGLLAMIVIASLMRAFLHLQSNGALRIENAVGCTGDVYLTIPSARTEAGKVMVTIQGRYTEFSAVTDEKVRILTGQTVEVVGLSDANTLIVRPKAS
ncbi:MAG: hypothetical protein RR482_04530 [Clostridia bacterium]